EILNEKSQIKIWFQNKRAKIKKASGLKNGLALHLIWPRDCTNTPPPRCRTRRRATDPPTPTPI
ncbi:unnamed protein product, partial [Staurois parvus]